jgi:hypothetical protein
METNTKTMLAAGGILAVALTIGSQIDGTKKPVMEPVSVEVSKAVKGAEIKSMRTVNSEVFKADSAWVHPKDARGAEIKADSFKVAAFTARVYARPKYFRDTDGDTLRPLDLTVREISALAKLNPLKTHDRYIDAGPYDARWMDAKPGDFRMDSGGAYVKYRALFKDAATAVQATADGMKELVTLADSTAPHTLRWIVKTDGSLVANAAGGFDVQAKDGTVPMRIQRPVVWDADNKPVMASATVEGDTLTFRVTVLPGQKYPVTVDPTTSVTAETIDSHTWSVDDSYETARNFAAAENIETTGNLLIGQSYDGAPNFDHYTYRTFMRFAPSITNLATVDACTLKVYCVNEPTNDFTLMIVGSSIAGAPATSWNNDFIGWAASGAYLIDPGVYGGKNTNTMSAGGWASIPYVTIGLDSLKAQVARADSHRIALLSLNDTENDSATGQERLNIYSTAESGKEPYLAITYTILTPGPLAVHAVSTTSVRLSWTDNIAGETGFRIYDLDAAAYVDSTAANDTTKVITGLTANTKKRYRIEVKGGTADGQQSASDSTYTLANKPAAPTVTNPVDSLALVKIDTSGTGNPTYTEYAIQDSITGKYIDGRFNRFFSTTAAESILWRTYAAWGGASGDTVKVGVGKKYNIRAKARSGL